MNKVYFTMRNLTLLFCAVVLWTRYVTIDKYITDDSPAASAVVYIKDQWDTNNQTSHEDAVTTGLSSDTEEHISTIMGPLLSMDQRVSLVKHRCSLIRKTNLTSYVPGKFDRIKQFLVNDRYKINICYNLKVGSTNIRRIMYILDQDNKTFKKTETVKQSTARKYVSAIETNIVNLSLTNRNVTFVREPLERLLSAYNDKRAFEHMFLAGNFTFRKYLIAILNTELVNLNMHLVPFYHRCRPCDVDYNYIGLMATYTADMNIVLHDIRADRLVNVPNRASTGYISNHTLGAVKKQFKDISPKLLHKLWVKYRIDYFVFGFPYPSHLVHDKWKTQQR